MIEAFQAIRDAIEPVAPNATITFVKDHHHPNSTRCIRSGVMINISVSEWKASSNELGQQGGFRIWEITIVSSRLDSLEKRWVSPSPSEANGIYDLAKAIRQTLSGHLLPSDSSPLIPLSGKALAPKNGSDLWCESFAEHLRATGIEPEYIVSSLSEGKLIVSNPALSSSFVVLENTDGIEVGHNLYAYNPSGALQFLGTVESKTSSLIYFEATLAHLPAIESRVHSVTNLQSIHPFPADIELVAIHPELLRTLSGKLIQTTVELPSQHVERIYAPLTLNQLTLLKQQFNITSQLNSALIEKGTELILEIYDQHFQEEPLGNGLWKLSCKGRRTHLYDPDLWAGQEAPA